MTFFNYHFPTHVVFGAGSRRTLGELLKARGARKPLIVTDRGLAQLPLPSELQGLLRAHDLDASIYAGVAGNPVGAQVRDGVNAYREHGADSIVALGGGAALDVAKVIGLCATNPGDLWDYDALRPKRTIEHPLPPLAAVPTTAGTGSEVGRAAVVSRDDDHQKIIFFSPKLLPQEVVVDPELTLGLPPLMTAATGMDAVTHLVEAYLANGFQPLCDGIAREGLRLAGGSLERAVSFAKRGHQALSAAEQAEHVAVRGMMMNAALMGAVAFQKGLGVTHSCAHALSTVCDLHHGTANGVLMPYTMRFNAKAVPERLADLAVEAGAEEPTAQGFVSWLAGLNAELGIPRTLGALGVNPSHINELVKFALADGCHTENPCPVSEADFRALFEEAIG